MNHPPWHLLWYLTGCCECVFLISCLFFWMTAVLVEFGCLFYLFSPLAPRLCALVPYQQSAALPTINSSPPECHKSAPSVCQATFVCLSAFSPAPLSAWLSWAKTDKAKKPKKRIDIGVNTLTIINANVVLFSASFRQLKGNYVLFCFVSRPSKMAKIKLLIKSKTCLPPLFVFFSDELKTFKCFIQAEKAKTP